MTKIDDQGKSLQQALSDGAKRLEEGPLKGPSGFLDDMSTHAYDLKQKVILEQTAHWKAPQLEDCFDFLCMCLLSRSPLLHCVEVMPDDATERQWQLLQSQNP